MKIALFFTRAMSLRRWHKTGLIDREIAPYLKMSDKGVNVIFITYGAKDDLEYLSKDSNIKILFNKWGLPTDLYALLIPWLHRKQLRNVSVLKTNQINGWWAAGITKLFYKAPMVLRGGYLLSMNQEQRWKGYSRFRIGMVSLIEKIGFRYCDYSIVTTPEMKAQAIRRHGIFPGKVEVVPNNVDTNVFKPKSQITKMKGSIGFVGSFKPQKNIPMLLEALQGLSGVTLHIVGDGSQKARLGKMAKQFGVNVLFEGNVSNFQLPALLNRFEMFVLPSEWEGMPKALVEAMACGLPVIGTDVHGIRDIIQHDVNGILCRESAQSVQAAIVDLLNNPEKRERLGLAARRYVVNRYSLNQIVKIEMQLMKNVIKKHHCRGDT